MGEVKQLLIKKILDYYENQNYSFNDIYSPEFIIEANLKDLWNRRENKNDKWKSFVKFVLFDQKEKKYIFYACCSLTRARVGPSAASTQERISSSHSGPRRWSVSAPTRSFRSPHPANPEPFSSPSISPPGHVHRAPLSPPPPRQRRAPE